MKHRYHIALLLLLLSSAPALGQMLNHALRASAIDVPSQPRQVRALPDTINLLAVMVQFQTDKDTRTSGNGTFDTTTTVSQNIPIDAPPRNFQYFEDHLTFLSNYYRKVSKGKTIIRSTLIPTIIQLPTVMGTYSPPKNGSNRPVALLAQDTWRAVDSAKLVGDFAPFQCFVVFHAGVGRDIDLVGVLGYDPNPLDIPSLYLSSAAFMDLLGTPGISVQNGSFLIPNSLIMPETESRSVPGLGGDVFLEYGINGLLCASVGNFMGLPDLFDTKTGATAIGRFGLMDGQSIFSFSGVFPPEPSAWEKYWLGWLDPINVPIGTTTVSLPAVALADSIYRIGVNAHEYYLVENRNRDAQQNGQRITSRYRGTTTTLQFRRDTTGFNAFDVSALSGTVTDVEDFDWSLPGGIGDDGSFYDGGVLIWHIDERVIADGIATNSVNAKPELRGVDLEEADGSQDIGQTYGFLSAGSGSENGTALDFWYKGNSAPVFKNEFSATTFPNTNTNGDALSHVTIGNFAARAPRMTAVVSLGGQTLSPLPQFPKNTGHVLTEYALTVGPFRQGSEQVLLVSSGSDSVPPLRRNSTASQQVASRMYALTSSGSPLLGPRYPLGDAVVLPVGSRQFRSGAAVRDITGDGVDDMVSVSDEPSLTLRSYTLRDGNADGLADTLFSLSLAGAVTCSPLIGDSVILIGNNRGVVYAVNFQGRLIASGRVLSDTMASVLGVSKARSAGQFVVTGSDGTVATIAVSFQPAQVSVAKSVRLNGRLAGPAASSSLGAASSGGIIAVATTEGTLHVLDEGLSLRQGYPRSLNDSCSQSPALADVDGDGQRDIVVFSGRTIWVYNHVGAVLDHFPITVSSPEPLSSNPVVGDCDGDGVPEIVAVTEDGIVYAYRRSGDLAAGFPLSAGTGRQAVAFFFKGDSLCLAVASAREGTLHAWFTGRGAASPQGSRYPWPQFQQNAGRTGSDFAILAGQPLSSEFFPASRAYNWPNPVYDGKTSIRYFLRDAADVRVRIVDLAGDRVAELRGPGVGGMDNEVQWDVAGVQSGIYFAHIEAIGAGESGKAVVKIAVVK